MNNNMQTAMEAFFPDGRIYEYFLQRLRLVASQHAQVLTVQEIEDAPDAADEFPCIKVVLLLRGLKIYNRATGVRMLSTGWIKNHFEGQLSQIAFLDAFAADLERSIPADHREAHLKPKFKQYRSGAPGYLPARADLYVWGEGLVQHLTAARKWLRLLNRPKHEFSKKDRAAFLKEISHPMFWWAEYVRQGQITLVQIARQSPRATAMDILGLRFAKADEPISHEALKSRLRPEG